MPSSIRSQERGRYLLSLAVLLGLGFACSSCGLFSEEDSSNGRLVIGESVDGVPLGADTSHVWGILGPPTQIVRNPGSITFRYADGRHAGMQINFRYPSTGTVERTLFALSSPYSGRTRDGIGLGSSRDDVLTFLGEPDHSGVGSGGALFERYDGMHFEAGFLYEEERVINITMSDFP